MTQNTVVANDVAKDVSIIPQTMYVNKHDDLLVPKLPLEIVFVPKSS